MFTSVLYRRALLTAFLISNLGPGMARLTAAEFTPPTRSTYYDGSSRVTFSHRAEYGAQVAMTVEAWIYTSNTNVFQTIVSHDFNRSFWFGLESNNQLRFYRSGGFPDFEDSTQSVPMHRWTHVAASFDGTRVRFYIDGELAGDEALSHAGAGVNAELWLGDDPGGALNFYGFLDEVRLWNVARSGTEIRDNRFEEIRTASGLAAQFPTGGALNFTANALGTAVGAVERGWGVLPRDFVIPATQVPINYDSSLDEFTANGAERIIWRYRTDGGGQRDVEGFVLYRDEPGDRNLYIAVPNTPFRADTVGLGQPLWFSFMADTNNIVSSSTQTDDLRIDSSADNLTTGVATNRLLRGAGDNWVYDGDPAAGTGSWDVVTFASCEFDCGRIFRVPRSMLGGFDSTKRGLFGEFAYGAKDGFPPDFNLPSPFDGDPTDPTTWPLLIFTDPSVVLPTVRVTGTVVENTLGTNRPISGVTIRLFNADSGTVFATQNTGLGGTFNIETTVFPADATLRLTCGVPETGTWRNLTPSVNSSTHEVISLDRLTGITFGSCEGETICDLGSVRFRLIRYVAPAIDDFSPRTGSPHLVLRSGTFVTTPATRFTLRGANFHDFTTFHLAHRSCEWPLGLTDPLPSGPNCTNFPLRVVARSTDWSELELELDFDLDAQLHVPSESWLRGPYRILCRDSWLGGYVSSTPDFVIQEQYPEAHGFEFFNERDGTQFDEFSGVYQWKAYDCITPIGPFAGANPCVGCRLPNPVYLGFYFTVFTPWAELSTGSCLGMASTSRLMANRALTSETFDPAAQYAGGLLGVPYFNEDGEFDGFAPPKPQEHRFRVCDYSEPVNLWAHIHNNQSAQISSEFLNTMLDQMSGTGFAPLYAYSIDGNPNAVLGRLRVSISDYVLGFQYSGDLIKAHSVTPYRIVDGYGWDTNTHSIVERPESTAVFVYDSNHPRNNQRFIEIDRERNEYRYYWGYVTEVNDGVTNSFHEYWDGTAIYTIPLSLFQNARTMPGADILLRGLALVLFGGADGTYEDAEGGQWGWDDAGDFHDTYVGAKAVAPFTGQNPNLLDAPPANNIRTAFFFPPTNSPPKEIRVNVRDSDWRFFAGESGVLCLMETANSPIGGQDIIRVKAEPNNGPLAALEYISNRNLQYAQPLVGVISSNAPSSLYQWYSLYLQEGQAMEFGGDRATGGAVFRNHSDSPLHFSLRAYRNGPQTLTTNDFGPFTVPPHAVHRVTFTGWPTATLRSELDLDGDGSPESVTFLTPLGEQNPPPSLRAELINGFMKVSWPVDSVPWLLEQTFDLGTVGVGWTPVSIVPEESNGELSVHLPLQLTDRIYLRLRRAPN